jgi:hypothetical protein
MSRVGDTKAVREPEPPGPLLASSVSWRSEAASPVDCNP